MWFKLRQQYGCTIE